MIFFIKYKVDNIVYTFGESQVKYKVNIVGKFFFRLNVKSMGLYRII